MKIIGIHNTGITSSAALLVNGKIISGISEERITREKYSKYFPHKAISNCLLNNNLKIQDIDIFAIGWNPAINIGYRYRAGLSEWQQHAGERFFSNPNNLLPKITKNRSINFTEQVFNYNNIEKTKILYVTHHLAHISNAFYYSNFNEAGILSFDGYGEKTTMCWAIANKTGIKIVNEINFPHSLGQFYSTITEFLGFRPDHDEWKVMGASAYGNNFKYLNRLKHLINLNDKNNFELDLTYFNHFNFESKNMFSDKLISLIGKPRKKNDTIEKKHFDIAASAQKILEDYVFSSLKWFKQKYNIKNICLTGGLFMNSVLNGKIHNSNLFKNIYIPFAPDDSGNSIGSAFYAYNLHNKNKTSKTKVNDTPFIGSQYSNFEIKKILDSYNLKYINSKNIVKDTAQILNEGFIIGWFQGRSEFGQRALGNRSILADPRLKHMKNKINSAIKFRESFRPFAPVIIDKYAKDYFIGENLNSKFMEKVYYFKKNKVSKVPAVVHVDNSGRIQTISNDFNKMFYDLIKEFCLLSKVPILLNTSFNLNNEPIVNSPKDAIRTFYTSGLDYLVIGNFILKK